LASAHPSAFFASGQTSALQRVPVIPRMRRLTRSHGCCQARAGSSGLAERVEEPIGGGQQHTREGPAMIVALTTIILVVFAVTASHAEATCAWVMWKQIVT
jgi:hypothetical protein